MTKIKTVHAREILDSRGNPTVEAEVELVGGIRARAAVPSGASTGEHEALELRDGDRKRYRGKGVLRAVENVNQTLARAVSGASAEDQVAIDSKLREADGTANKSNMGANAILAVSLASARAAALAKGVPLWKHLHSLDAEVVPPSLPVPLMNIINGGAHADNALDVQEFMIVPHGFDCFSEALRAGAEIFHELKSLLSSRKLSTSVGDEGGFAPQLERHEEALEVVASAIAGAGYEVGQQVSLALDCAASEFFNRQSERYTLEGKSLSAEELVDLLASWRKRFPIVSIEDGCAEDDWAGWEVMTQKLGANAQLVGDDLFVTNVERVKTGRERNVANAILIKVNQIGTLTETMDTVRYGREHGYRSVASHRSGETSDSFIADLAVGLGMGQIKTGSASRSERLAKYNELLRIEESLGNEAIYANSFFQELKK